MDVTPLIRVGQKVIQSYAAGRFKISGENFDGPVLVTPFAVAPWAGDADRLSPEGFAHLAGEIDVLLIGTGRSGRLVMPETRAAFRQAGLGLDVMDTGAACRTFNVLTAEGRRVAAALIPV
jgi:uncharacterized protein